ncbi:3-deoxy-7-phosphoheptulonate synthase [Corallococcus exiguus]|uniref:3-deoxy-7-phosphoheptulonate synthase n=1 Tax=Corallococcus TaxID=83461 RepID=UPI000EDEC5E0|nr:3-deoxy-7-phosphoheptulonate synthase [Corallococcus sp. AB032C]NNB87005.1 3-deoxy-7-phosphoheptulonate synthase [Corallococcus exiguus]NNB99138.1 3-deoxy-7-phosphoheptulonate synthase [Corallococcus exiguus]NNC01699.1 3-deoxy-7-phosphoheptulonate synthase [Corallococcus exiguus]NPC53175.1 3-deoxy-7-phosphoheptulonate synthase [Corallococcus exiguus]RKH84483.1 3-deoxy-7-phosphoheptulonate synthase [Corallococcus sp. AB032C]
MGGQQPDDPAGRRDPGAHRVLRAARPAGTRVQVGAVEVGGPGFVVMAGPCAVEGSEQLELAARAVAQAGAHLLRGGVFKPRTSPYAFQGMGEPGLKLLVDAGRRHGLPTISEVMETEQLPLMAQHADILQVGARNMQNFGLLRALGKLRKPVLLKRGLSATVQEWLNAAEYILAGGNEQVMLCERGIRTFETAMRNTLDLAAVAWAKERTHLPVIVDPSHATGIPSLITPMSLAAAACGADGLLIEVHPRPEQALCDGQQAMSPGDFATLMQRLPGVLAAVDRHLWTPAGPAQIAGAR